VSRPASLFLLLASVTTLVGAATPRQEPERPFLLVNVAPNIWAAIDNPKANPSSGANAGFIIGDDGVVVIDTFADAASASELLREIRTRTNLPVKFVVNSHYHADHVAGNRVFMDAGALVVAHRNVRDWIHTENVRMLTEAAANQPVYQELRARMEAFAPPSLVFDDSVTVYLGSREIRLRSFPGHTGGDVAVVIPDVKVMFTGDLFWRHSIPNTIDASTRPWIDTLNTIVRDEAGYSFVPGHGQVGTAQDVTAFRDYLVKLRQWVTEAQSAGRSTDAVAPLVTPKLTAEFGGWDYFKYLAPQNIQQMDAELRGRKRIPKPAQ